MKDFFNYELPESKIATRPLWYNNNAFSAKGGERGQSRLLHARYKKSSVEIVDREFKEVTGLLKSGDLLILNNTKVLNTRFKFLISSGKEIEVLLTTLDGEDLNFSSWLALARPMKLVLSLDQIDLSNSLSATVKGIDDTGRFLRLEVNKKNQLDQRTILEIISDEGMIPIPPYIRGGISDEADNVDYQTVYAEHPGSVAAPTAGLHFSKEILLELQAKGVIVEYLTLHVGPASFLPVNDPMTHRPFPEMYSVSKSLWKKIENTKNSGDRVIAVGTTVIRSLESFALRLDFEDSFDKFIKTDLFITPGFDFKIIKYCFTNFHQPKSTHLLLVMALVGQKNLEEVYAHALKSDYRFLSYGDSSFLEFVG